MGAQSVTVALAGSDSDIIFGVASFYGVDQIAPFAHVTGSTGSGGIAQAGVTSKPDDMTFTLISHNGFFLGPTGCTTSADWNTNPNTQNGHGAHCGGAPARPSRERPRAIGPSRALIFRGRATHPGRKSSIQAGPLTGQAWALPAAFLIGNVLGTLGYHRVYQDSSPDTGGTPGDPAHSIYVLGYSGSQEGMTSIPYDPLVMTTLLRQGNYDYARSQTQWIDNMPIALPASFFLSAKPEWWGTMPWPAIGPDIAGGTADPPPGAGHVYKIPAPVCYETTARRPDGTLICNANNCYGSAAPRSATPRPKT